MEERVSELFSENIPLVSFVMRSYGFTNHYLADDLRQEGLIGLMKASESHDPSKGFAFSSYATKCIRNRMLNYLDKESSVKRHLAYHKNVEDLEFQDNSPDLREVADLNDSIKQVRQSIESLSEELGLIFRYRFRDDLSYKKSGDILGVSPQTVMRRERELKRVMRVNLSNF